MNKDNGKGVIALVIKFLKVFFHRFGACLNGIRLLSLGQNAVRNRTSPLDEPYRFSWVLPCNCLARTPNVRTKNNSEV